MQLAPNGVSLGTALHRTWNLRPSIPGQSKNLQAKKQENASFLLHSLSEYFCQ